MEKVWTLPLVLGAGAAFVAACACGDDDDDTLPTADAGQDGGELDAGPDAPDDRPAYDPTLPELADEAGCDVAFSDVGDVRVLAMGKMLRLDEAESIESYREAMHRFFKVHAAGCVTESRPTIVVWPEDAGLHAVLAGSRGARARGASNGLGAFLELAAPLEVPANYYVERFDLDFVSRFAQLALLATSDVAWRAVGHTFAAMAERYGVTMVVTTNLPDLEETTDADAIAALADPDYRRPESVFRATGPDVWNTSFFFGPDGALVAAVKKTYITPPEEDTLLMSAAPLDQMVPVALAGGRFGVVISKDAWMPDVLGRLDDLGADVMLQPEAFSGWAVPPPEEWQPDIVLEGSWNHVQHYGSARFNVLPCLTGNFLDTPFDGQSAIFADASRDDPPAGFVGQPGRTGFVTVGPWVMADPGEADPDLTLEERRAALRERGTAMLPGSGAPEENGYIESVVGADLAITAALRDEGPVAVSDFGPSTLVSEVEVGATTRERNADLCLHADDPTQVEVVWEAGPIGRRRIESITGDLERADPFAGALTRVVLRGGDVRQPAVGCVSTGLVLATVDDSDGPERILVQRPPGLGPTAALEGDFRLVSRPAIAVDALDAARVAIAFHADDGTAARLWLSRSTDGGATFEPPRRVDDTGLDGRGPRVNQWAPAVAWRGDTLLVAGVDFRAYSWDGIVLRSDDGGDTFGAPLVVTPVPDERERLYDQVQIAIRPDGVAMLAWGGVRERRPDADVAWADLDEGAVAPGPEHTLHASAAASDTSEWAVTLSAPDAAGAVGIAWQDFAPGRPGIWFVEREAGSDTTGSPLRVDDSDAPGTHALAPVVALGAARVLVVWEDTREGVTRLRAATRGR